MKIVFALFMLVSFLESSATAETRITSMYTDLSGPACQMVKEDEETGSSVKKCPGVGGFHLLVADDDARMSISVVTPEGTEHALDYWSIVTRAFSNLGKKAEWRVSKKGGALTPVALIVRIEATEQDNLPSPRKKAYLAVAKITSSEICVVKKIGPVAKANEQARVAADAATTQECLKP